MLSLFTVVGTLASKSLFEYQSAGATKKGLNLQVNSTGGLILVTLFGKNAENANSIDPNTKLMLCGKIELQKSADNRNWSEYQETYYEMATMNNPSVTPLGNLNIQDSITGTIVGKMGKDPEVKFFDSGKNLTNVSIAVNSSKKGGDSSWFKVTCWNKTGETVGNYCKKGQQHGFIGRLQADSYTNKEGINKINWKFTGDTLAFGNNKKDDFKQSYNNTAQALSNSLPSDSSGWGVDDGGADEIAF